MVEVPWCSIIVPTTVDDPPTLLSLPDQKTLSSMGVELILVKDRIRAGASRTRNIGAAVAKGKVLCFIDDDVVFNFSELYGYMLRCLNEESIFFWADAPHILIVKSDLFFRAGGYDERHPYIGGEAVEIRECLKSLGLELRMLEISLKHLRNTWDKKHALLTNKSLTWTYINYHYLPLRRVLWRKHPVELVRRWVWALEWILIQKRRKRSILVK